MITVIQVFLLLLAALAGLLLAVPFGVKVRGKWPDRFIRARISWGGALAVFNLEARPGEVSPSLAVLGMTVWRGQGKESPRREKRDKREKGKKVKGRSGFSAREGLRILADRELWGEAVSFLRRVKRALRMEARMEGVYGAEDPALTGMAAGLLGVLSSEKVVLNLQPDFCEEVLDIEGFFSSRFFLGELLGIGLALLWRKPVRRLWVPRLKAKFKFKRGIDRNWEIIKPSEL